MKLKPRELFLLGIGGLSVTTLLLSNFKAKRLIGTWSTVSNVGAYINPSSGQILGNSATSHHVTLNADGTYQKTDYYQFYGNDCKWFQHSGTYEIQGDLIVFNPEESDWAICGMPSQKRPLEPLSSRWRFHKYNDGWKLELLGSIGTQDWAYAERLTRQE
jgi:hypothetical protein